MRNRSLLFSLLFGATSLIAQDSTPPVLQNQLPPASATVRELSQIEVIFSENVTNLNAGDLLVNGVGATNVINVNGVGAGNQFVFEFPPAANGVVNVAFVFNHGITDVAVPPNSFAGGNWTYTVDPNAPISGVVISEFLAVNNNGIRDEDGDRSDWIEIYNGAGFTVDITGWYLTDDVTKLTKWRFPTAGIAEAGYLLVYASSKDRTNPAAPLHTNFRLSNAAGSYLALVDQTGTNIMSVFNPYPAQSGDISFGRDRVDPSITGFYTNSTPRAANTSAGAGVMPEVIFSRNSSTFITTFDLTLSVDDTNALIRYLIVNNAATASTNVFLTANSPIYTGPIPVNGTMQVRARAFPKTGSFFPSPLHSESYIQLSADVLNFTSDLPLIIIHNFGQNAYPATEGAQTELNSVMAVFDADLDRSSLTNHPVLVKRAGINTRGSSTLGYAKKSFAVEFWDEFNEGSDEELLGMPAESDWTLYGPNNFEPSLIHNPLYYRMSREVGRYASRTRFAEVFLNATATGGPVGTNHYNGIYVVEERPKRAKGRVDIEALQPEDTNAPAVTGGYFLSVDRVDANERSFATPAVGVVPGQTVIYKSPKGTDILLPQRDPQEQYIRGYFGSFVTNLASPGFNSPTGYVQYVDVDSWIDHMIISVTAFNVDALRLSGFFYKDRNKPIEMGPVWDCDRCLGSTDGRDAAPRTWRSATGDLGTDFFNYPWWNRLFNDPNFWQRYIDRYQEIRKVAYSDTNMFAIIDGFAAELTEAYPREFAKYRQLPRTANGSSTTGGTYESEIEWKKNWMAARLNFMETNFLSQVIFTPGGPVSTNGQVTSGFTLTLTPPNRVGGQTAPSTNAVVYYTLDGTDPRASGGGVAAGALSNLGPVTITVTSNVCVFARAFNPLHRNLFGANRPPLSSSWSGPTEATYWIATPPLRITEIMYHPEDAPAGNTNDQDNFEYVEVKNIGAAPMSVKNARLRGGVDFDFPDVTLAAGQSAVIVKNIGSFQSRYGNTDLILGTFAKDNLANDGEGLVLQGPVREPILNFSYDDDWYPSTDGLGFSLQIVNENAALDTWGLASSWRPSGAVGGSPGESDPGAANIATIYVNEALTHTDPSPGDAIELYNPTAGAVDIGDWYLSDSFNSPKKYRIPAGTTIAANGYLVFYQSNSFGLGVTGFALSSKGDAIYVSSGNAAGNLTGWIHGFDFGAQVNGATFGRHITSTGADHFVTQASPTLGAQNSGPKVGPVVISEINYHPPDFVFPRGTLDNSAHEYIELQNITGAAASLFDPLNPANTWRLRDAVSYTFPPGVSIPAGGYLLVVGFNPTNAAALADFRNANGVSPATPIYGPWDGQLDNSGDSVELVRPDLPDPAGSPTAGFVPQILTDKVNYSDAFPWPTGLPDGLGAALGRVDAAAYGNDPGNWRTSPKTPGGPLPTGDTAPAIVTQPSNAVGTESYGASFTVIATGSNLGYQWTYNGAPIPAGAGPTLTLTGLRLNQAGNYACYVFNSAGAVLSSNATLTVRPLPVIVRHPASLNMRGSTNESNFGFTTNNASFSVAATGTGTLTYQWRFNGTNIPGATATNLVVANVGLTNDGLYDVVITDDVAAPITSLAARLTVLVSPVVILSPGTSGTNITVVSNANFTASVIVRGNPPPFRFEWREGSTGRATNTSNSGTNFLTFGPVTNLAPRLWRLVIFNDANPAPGTLSQFVVTALADFDRDGLADDWETQFGFNPATNADRDIDSDGDGLSNYAEFIAGTNPTNAANYLKVDISTVANVANIEIPAVANRTYTVQYTDSLSSGAWSKLGDIVAQNTDRLESLPDPNYTTNRFYRLITPRQP